jgi:hypothetical protein
VPAGAVVVALPGAAGVLAVDEAPSGVTEADLCARDGIAAGSDSPHPPSDVVRRRSARAIAATLGFGHRDP